MVKLGDPVAARAPLEESVALFRVAGDRQRLVLPIDALGLVALQQEDYPVRALDSRKPCR